MFIRLEQGRHSTPVCHGALSVRVQAPAGAWTDETGTRLFCHGTLSVQVPSVSLTVSRRPLCPGTPATPSLLSQPPLCPGAVCLCRSEWRRLRVAPQRWRRRPVDGDAGRRSVGRPVPARRPVVESSTTERSMPTQLNR